MRYSGTWLTPEDEALLEHLREHGSVAVDELHNREVIEFSRDYIEQRCSMLAGRGRLVSFADGRYRITPKGESYLDAELDPAELPTD